MKKILIISTIIFMFINLSSSTITVHTVNGDETINLSEIEDITIEKTITDIDGNVYPTLIIGEQEWMTSNLKVTHYNNGEPIPTDYSNAQWSNLSTGAYCIYDNDPVNADIYGALYNWYAVNDPRGIAPEGWHVATDEEIMELEMFLGMSESEANDFDYRGTNEGSKLAGRSDLWADGLLESNPEFGTSGFNFLPGGYRYYTDGAYSYKILNGYLWTSTENAVNHAWYRLMDSNYSEIARFGRTQQCGFSVRCVRD